MIIQRLISCILELKKKIFVNLFLFFLFFLLRLSPDITKYVCLSQSMPWKPTRQTMEDYRQSRSCNRQVRSPAAYSQPSEDQEPRVPRGCNDLLELLRNSSRPVQIFYFELGLYRKIFFEQMQIFICNGIHILYVSFRYSALYINYNVFKY